MLRRWRVRMRDKKGEGRGPRCRQRSRVWRRWLRRGRHRIRYNGVGGGKKLAGNSAAWARGMTGDGGGAIVGAEQNGGAQGAGGGRCREARDQCNARGWHDQTSWRGCLTSGGPVGVNPFRTRIQHGRTDMTGRRPLLFLTNCSDDSKPYMIRVALIKGFQNHIKP